MIRSALITAACSKPLLKIGLNTYRPTLKHHTLDTLIAVGSYDDPIHVELFSLSSSKWQIKKDYPYSEDIYSYSILAVERKFIIFGGFSDKRKVLTNQDIKSYENI